MNRVVHFEIPCDNPEKAMHFFTTVFGWQFSKFGNEEYWTVKTGNESPGIDGGLKKKKDPKHPLVNSIEVKDLHAKAEEIKKAGGIIVFPKTAIPGIGWVAHFTDPDGNIHGLYQNDPSAS